MKPVPPSSERGEQPSSSNLPAILRRHRRDADLTLKEVADRCGLAVSTISKLENGKLSPGYETIVQLAHGLGVDVAELFGSHPSSATSARRGVTRRGQGPRHSSLHYDYELQAHDVANKHFLPLVATIRARSTREFGQLPAHQGEEFIYVVSGTLEVHTQHYEPLVLSAGDSVYFDSTMGHACLSVGEEDARIVWVCSRITAEQVSAQDLAESRRLGPESVPGA